MRISNNLQRFIIKQAQTPKGLERRWYHDEARQWYDNASPELQEYLRNKVVKAPGTSGTKVSSSLYKFFKKQTI